MTENSKSKHSSATDDKRVHIRTRYKRSATDGKLASMIWARISQKYLNPDKNSHVKLGCFTSSNDTDTVRNLESGKDKTCEEACV